MDAGPITATDPLAADPLFATFPHGQIIQTVDSIRAWKKVILMVDPSMPTWRRDSRADTCRYATLYYSYMEFGVAEILIPSGSLIFLTFAEEKTETYEDGSVRTKYPKVLFGSASSVRVVNVIDACGIHCKTAKSIYGKGSLATPDDDITYEVGRHIFPGQAFSLETTIFAPGIHFTDSFESAWNI